MNDELTTQGNGEGEQEEIEEMNTHTGVYLSTYFDN